MTPGIWIDNLELSGVGNLRRGSVRECIRIILVDQLGHMHKDHNEVVLVSSNPCLINVVSFILDLLLIYFQIAQDVLSYIFGRQFAP
jgi:hypothetical protein